MMNSPKSDSFNRRKFLQLTVGAVATAGSVKHLLAESASMVSIPEDTIFTSASRLAKMIRNKEISSVELVTAYLQRVDKVNPRINALVLQVPERALDEARKADEALARGINFGPLHGVPCTIKDSLDTEGIITTGGTLGRKDFVPSRDATVVARLRDAGAIIIGKSNTPELTLSYQTTNLIYGRTENPYKIGRQPGGSTGGGAAIVAAGGSPFDIGTDFGGSIRVPAHACGIAGLKPSTGRVPRTGHIVGYGGIFDSFQVVGPLARWVEDLELVTNIIRGPDYLDAAIVPAPWLDPRQVDTGKLRVAFYVNNGSKDAPTPETEAAVRRAASLFKEAGCEVIEDCPEALIKESQELRNAMSGADGRAWVKRLLDSYNTKEYAPTMRFNSDNQSGPDRFTEIVELMDGNRSRFLSWFKQYDLILAPVTDQPAERWPFVNDTRPGRNEGNFGHTPTYNNTGWPGTVVRAGTSPEGLPIGVQMIAHPFREDVSLAAAYLIEAGTGGYQKVDL